MRSESGHSFGSQMVADMKERKMETIEILMATYNGSLYITEQIESILAQTYKDWILTISDDGSGDNTVDIIESYVAKYPQKIRRISGGHSFGNAREHFFWLMQNCTSDYICFCDQDDVWQANKLELFINAMGKLEFANGTELPLLVFSDLRVVDEKLNTIHPSIMLLQQQKAEIADYRELLFKNVVNGNAMMINAPLAKLASKCKSPSDTIMHDWWIAITAARFGKIAYIDEATIHYRQHSGNDVGAKKTHGLLFYVKKLLNMQEAQIVFNRKAKQAGVFLDTFANALPEEECAVLKAYSERKMPIGMKIDYLKWLTSFMRKTGFLFFW